MLQERHFIERKDFAKYGLVFHLAKVSQLILSAMIESFGHQDFVKRIQV